MSAAQNKTLNDDNTYLLAEDGLSVGVAATVGVLVLDVVDELVVLVVDPVVDGVLDAVYTSITGLGSVSNPVGQSYVASLLNFLNSFGLFDASGQPLKHPIMYGKPVGMW